MRAGRRPVVAVVGLGLIGGSLARALAAKGYRVLGVEPRARARAAARRAKAVAAFLPGVGAALARADVVLLAAPPLANRELLREIAGAAPGRRPIVSDVSSVKRPILAEARRLRGVDFVGGHPMAGRERGGFAASDASLFEGRPWVLCGGSARARRALAALARAAGARPVAVPAGEHDRAVALLSHLPQLVSWALADAARRDPVARRRLGLAGPGWADMTRLARSPRGLWREIVGENRRELDRALRAFLSALGRAR